MRLYRLIGGAIISIAVASWSSIASAQDEFSSRASCYLGLGGTFAHLLEAEDELSSNPSIDDSLGLNVRLGCLGGVAGGEVRYEYLDGFDVKDDNRKYTIDGWSMTLDLKLYPMRFFDDQLPPLARRFQPFATLGFGILKLDSSGQLDDWDFAARYGGGLDFYVTRNFGISTDVTVVDPMSDSLEDGEYLSFGWGVFYLY